MYTAVQNKVYKQMLGHLYSFFIMDINEQDIFRLILTNDIDSAKKLINHYSTIVSVNDQKQNLNDAWQNFLKKKKKFTVAKKKINIEALVQMGSADKIVITLPVIQVKINRSRLDICILLPI